MHENNRPIRRMYLDQNMAEINGVLIYTPSHLNRLQKALYVEAIYKQWCIDNIKLFKANVAKKEG